MTVSEKIPERRAKFAVGQLVHHVLFDYRGVVIDVDPTFQGSASWYQKVARTRPPKDKPWYHLLVHDASHTTYVAERNLEADASGEAIDHPLIDQVFDRFTDGCYAASQSVN